MKQRLRHYRDTCDKGINQEPETITQGQVADARNVWAPGGKLQTRPGYVGAGWPTTVRILDGVEILNDTSLERVATRKSGVYAESTAASVNLGTLNQGDAIFFAENYGGTEKRVALNLVLTSANTVANSYMVCEYWDGVNWRPLPTAKQHDTLWLDGKAYPLLYNFTAPNDWTATTVGGSLTSRKWIRWTVYGAAPTINVTINRAASTIVYTDPDATSAGIVVTPLQDKFVVLHGLQYRGLFSFAAGVGNSATQISVVDHVPIQSMDLYSIELNKIYDTDAGLDIPTELIFAWSNFPQASFAALPDFNVIVVSINQTLLFVDTQQKTVVCGETSSDPLLIGPRARYDAEKVYLSPSLPQAKYLATYDGRIFAAGIKGREHTVQWSEPSEAYTVWPLVNQEPLVEADNSPITGLALMGEQLVVTKQDSIWLMALTGPDPNGFDHYVPRQVVAGKGCVGHHTIASIEGTLVFMAEDGIYRFDGARVKSVTSSGGADKLAEFWPRINPIAYDGCSAIHWKQFSGYLLAVAIDDSTENDHVIFWDYERDAIFIWDNMPVHSWFIYEDPNDASQLGFVAHDGNLYVLGFGDTDNGTAISAYITTRRFGYMENERKVFRTLEVTGEQDAEFALSVALIPDDDTASQKTGTISFSDPNDSGGNRLRARRINVRSLADHLQVTLTQANKHARLTLSQIDIGYHTKGMR